MGQKSIDDERLVAASIASELRRVLTDAPTLTALRGLELPTLDALLGREGRTRNDLPDLIESAVGRLDDQVYRSAALDLFPLPYGDTGWQKLSARGRQAAERFGISYDGLRKTTDGRPSYLDRILQQVAEQLLAVVSEQSGNAQPIDLASAPTSAAAPKRHRARRWMIAPALLLAVVAIGSLLISSRRTPSHDASQGGSVFVPKGCKQAVGALDGSLAVEPDAAGITSQLVAIYKDSGNVDSLGCAVGPAYRWQAIAVQELSKDGRGNGALLASPNGVDLYLNNAAWGSYHQIGGKTGDVAQTTAGLPQRVVPYGDGHVEIEFSAGVVMVAERSDAPYFWIPSVFVTWWRSNQASLGLPTSNPLATFRQEFQHGYATVDPAHAGVPIITLLPHPEAELPAVDSIRGHIVRQADATTWFVSPDGKRQWIPDGPTWTCLGGDGKRVAQDLPGYAIATLPLGSQAQCP